MASGGKHLWIGMVEIRPLSGQTDLLGNAKGAFANIVTWAADAEQFRRNADLVIGKLGGLFISDVFDSEPVDTRKARLGGPLDDDIEDLILRAQTNTNAILYGTFYTFEKDDA
jgi:hypothetical protein